MLLKASIACRGFIGQLATAKRPMFCLRASTPLRGLSKLGPHDVASYRVALPPTDALRLNVNASYAHWEKQVHSALVCLVRKKLMSVDELRRGIEVMPAAQYHALSYYERWAASIIAVLCERRVLQPRDVSLDAADSPTMAFRVGQFVRVGGYDARLQFRAPHLRHPGYLHGAIGEVTRVCGVFENPAKAAFREADAPQPLYRVTFHHCVLWPEGTAEVGAAASVTADIFHPWLSLASLADSDAQLAAARRGALLSNGFRVSSLGRNHSWSHAHAHDDHHHHHDHHYHDHHNHQSRSEVESAALALEEGADVDAQPFRPAAEALIRALVTTGVIGAAELQTTLQAMEEAGSRGEGPRLVARAWIDPQFASLLARDAASAGTELGLKTSNYDTDVSLHPSARDSLRRFPHGHTVLQALFNTPSEHHLVVCTLCSCYPTTVLGMSPAWYKSAHYRARAVREPRAVLREFGLELPPTTAIHVHDSTAEQRYIVIPMRPPNTESLTEVELQGCVTRDSMIGIALASVPFP